LAPRLAERGAQRQKTNSPSSADLEGLAAPDYAPARRLRVEIGFVELPAGGLRDFVDEIFCRLAAGVSPGAIDVWNNML
jgi:hypothetical protein